MFGNREIHSVANSGKERKYLEETAAQHADGSSEAQLESDTYCRGDTGRKMWVSTQSI
ncbi:hypothetical protein PENSUB_1665 [Penicillium subrubescens]|uniref:Uncharacterized protein n=1 Tax=Penicillium subrubescens TaxID=1316194 RepID=A0A1Q5UJQ7_9EURO|nr:hypothetical protein PENSUB_1665 [Penicillium subrubescens]